MTTPGPWRKTDMRGCRPPNQPGGCQRLDLTVYARVIGPGKMETGHEWPFGVTVPCGVRVELKPGGGRKA